MITTGAYLLFYRRRSKEPLGGKILQDIVHSLDNQNHSSDEEDSGEGRGPGGNSSQHGSSSALKGVGVAHHQPDLPGSEAGEATKTVNPQDLEKLPLYTHHEQSGKPSFDDYNYDAFMKLTRVQTRAGVTITLHQLLINKIGVLGVLKKILKAQAP